MFAEERHNQIIQLLKSGSPVKVTQLSLLFSVSEATIRRDLQELENLGFLQRTHGGAVAPQFVSELSFQDREIYLLDEKRQIALAAAALVEDGETIMLDAGTTTREIARQLHGKRLTVVTNSMDVACVFADDANIDVLLLGGIWRKAINSLVGSVTNAMLKLLCFDKVFIAANAIDAISGVSTQNLAEAETKRAMLQAAKTSILVADHSKFGQKNFAQICSVHELSMVITDHGLPSDILESLKDHTKVIIAPHSLQEKGVDASE